MTQKLILTDITPPLKQKILNKIDFSITDGRIFFYSLFIYNKFLDWILDKEDKLLIGLSHLHLSNNSEIINGAGRLKVNSIGAISYIDNMSGHYKPNLENLLLSIKTLHDSYTLYMGDTEIYRSDETAYNNESIPVENRYDKKQNFSVDIKPENFLRQLSEDEKKYILEINNFDSYSYFHANPDLKELMNPYNPDLNQILIDHFLLHGQYEDGRRMC